MVTAEYKFTGLHSDHMMGETVKFIVIGERLGEGH